MASVLAAIASDIGKDLALGAADKLTDRFLASDVLSRASTNHIKDLLGKTKVTLNDLKSQLGEIQSGQEHILAQIGNLRAELLLDSRESEVNIAERAIQNFLEAQTDRPPRNAQDIAQRRIEMLHSTHGVQAHMNNYHSILVRNNGRSHGLLKTVVDYYWRKYEQGLEGEALKLDLVETCRRIVVFRNETIALQLIGLRLASDMTDSYYARETITSGVMAKLAIQATTLKNLLPSCVDLSSNDVHEFLTRSEFNLKSVEYPSQYLTTGYARWYKNLPWSDEELQVIPFVWSHEKPNAGLTAKNPKVYNWKVQKKDGLFQLIGYSVEWLWDVRKHAKLYDSPLEVDIRWESDSKGRVEKPGVSRNLLEGERGRYTARWAGERLLFKVILLRSHMKNMTDKPILRFVDKDWGSTSRNTQHIFSNEPNPKSTYELHHIG